MSGGGGAVQKKGCSGGRRRRDCWCRDCVPGSQPPACQVPASAGRRATSRRRENSRWRAARCPHSKASVALKSATPDGAERLGRLFDEVGEAAPVRHVVRVELHQVTGRVLEVAARRRTWARGATRCKGTVDEVAAVQVGLGRDDLPVYGVDRLADGLE